MRLYIEALENIFSPENFVNVTFVDKNLENFLPISNIPASAADGGAK